MLYLQWLRSFTAPTSQCAQVATGGQRERLFPEASSLFFATLVRYDDIMKLF